jgi:hypothetical protein
MAQAAADAFQERLVLFAVKIIHLARILSASIKTAQARGSQPTLRNDH